MIIYIFVLNMWYAYSIVLKFSSTVWFVYTHNRKSNSNGENTLISIQKIANRKVSFRFSFFPKKTEIHNEITFFFKILTFLAYIRFNRSSVDRLITNFLGIKQFTSIQLNAKKVCRIEKCLWTRKWFGKVEIEKTNFSFLFFVENNSQFVSIFVFIKFYSSDGISIII